MHIKLKPQREETPGLTSYSTTTPHYQSQIYFPESNWLYCIKQSLSILKTRRRRLLVDFRMKRKVISIARSKYPQRTLLFSTYGNPENEVWIVLYSYLIKDQSHHICRITCIEYWVKIFPWPARPAARRQRQRRRTGRWWAIEIDVMRRRSPKATAEICKGKRDSDQQS